MKKIFLSLILAFSAVVYGQTNGTINGVPVQITGGPAGTLSTAVRNTTTTTEALLNADCGGLVTFKNAASIAVSLPQANTGGNFLTTCDIRVQNIGAGTVTVTATTSTIDESGSVLTLTSGQGTHIISKSGNYYTERGIGGGTASVDNNSIANATGITGGGSANAITGTTTTTFPAAYLQNQVVNVKVVATNTGAVTININSLGTKAVTKFGSTALAAGNLVIGREYTMQYDGTQFQVLNPTLLAADIPSLGYLLPANNLSEVTPATARTNLGLGGIATKAATVGTAPQKGDGTGGLTPASNSDITALYSGCSGVLLLGADGSCHAGGSSSIFDGSNATNLAFSATPTINLVSVSTKNPVYIKIGTLTANITGVTFTNPSAGARFILEYTQPSSFGSGGPFSVAYGGSISSTWGVCPTAQEASGKSRHEFIVEPDGTTIDSLNCYGTSQFFQGPEVSAPGTPGSGSFFCWPDAIDHSGFECKANGSTNVFAMVLKSIDINTITGQVLSTHLSAPLPVSQGGLGIATAQARVGYIAVAGCNNATPGAALDLPTASAPTPVCHGTTTTTGTLDYADSGNTKATFEIVLPTGWTGNEDITLDWYTASTSVSGKWTIETSCKTLDGDLVTSPTYNSAQTITTTSSGTANGLSRSTQTAVTTTGCSAGNIQIIRVGRDVTDTSTATHSLLGIELVLRVTPQA